MYTVVVESFVKGQDVLVSLSTRSGKSLCYRIFQQSKGEKLINCGGCGPSKGIDDQPGWYTH